MTQIKSTEELIAKINLLQTKQAKDKTILIQDFIFISEQLTPENLIKSSVNNLIKSTKIKEVVISSSLILASNILLNTISSVIIPAIINKKPSEKISHKQEGKNTNTFIEIARNILHKLTE